VVLVLVGVSIGVPLALPSGRVLEGLLFGVTANDPLTLTGSVAVRLSATVLATCPSLWRVSRSDPATAIRREGSHFDLAGERLPALQRRDLREPTLEERRHHHQPLRADDHVPQRLELLPPSGVEEVLGLVLDRIVRGR
jgi:hypothetical protein